MIKLYKIFFPLFFLPVIFILSIFSKKIRSGSLQKLGYYDFKSPEKTFWIHAVSVGEVNSLIDFIKNNREKNIILTTSTPQGLELAQNKLSEYVYKICYFPYDTDIAILNAIKAINPYLVMIFETEIWPNFADVLKSKNIPLFISNGRISDSTFNTYKKLKFFFKNVFASYTAILAQSEEDREKFVSIGANNLNTKVMGNIKFDIKKPDENIKIKLQNYYKSEEKQVIIAGSTHAGEDEIIVNLYKKLKQDFDIKLVIAPRHLERIQSIEDLFKKNNINYALKTSGKNFDDTDVILLDTTGELSNIYSISKFSFIGGSFDETGGHNPLEATIWGVPTISGPNIKNFKVIYKELQRANCAKVVHSENELCNIAKKLLKDEKFYIEMCKNSQDTISENSGATEFLTKFIEGILNEN